MLPKFVSSNKHLGSIFFFSDILVPQIKNQTPTGHLILFIPSTSTEHYISVIFKHLPCARKLTFIFFLACHTKCFSSYEFSSNNAHTLIDYLCFCYLTLTSYKAEICFFYVISKHDQRNIQHILTPKHICVTPKKNQ